MQLSIGVMHCATLAVIVSNSSTHSMHPVDIKISNDAETILSRATENTRPYGLSAKSCSS